MPQFGRLLLKDDILYQFLNGKQMFRIMVMQTVVDEKQFLVNPMANIVPLWRTVMENTDPVFNHSRLRHTHNGFHFFKYPIKTYNIEYIVDHKYTEY